MASYKMIFCNSVCDVSATLSVTDQSTFKKGDSTDADPSALVGSSKASLSHAGQDANGGIDLDARFGGASFNNHRLELKVGATGVGNENRALSADLVDGDIVVTFGTGGSGNSVTPTAQQVADAINADPPEPAEGEDTAKVPSAVVIATPTGDGTGLVNTLTPTNMAGGADDGDEVMVNGVANRIATIEVS